MQTEQRRISEKKDICQSKASGTLQAHARKMLTGIALCFVLAGSSIMLGQIGWMAAHGLSALTIAIMLGIAIGNTYYSRIGSECGAGVAYSKQTLLRIGVVLYGLRLTLQDIGHVGLAGVLIDVLVLSTTFGLALLIGTRLLKLDRATAILIGAGSSICGAAAIMATEPVVRAHSEKVAVAVSTVVVFGTVSIFLYPALFELNRLGALFQGSHACGTTPACTSHEVAQLSLQHDPLESRLPTLR